MTHSCQHVANMRGDDDGSRANEGYFLLASGDEATILDDDVTDILRGQQNSDWFFADLDGEDGDDDKVKDKNNEEILDGIFAMA